MAKQAAMDPYGPDGSPLPMPSRRPQAVATEALQHHVSFTSANVGGHRSHGGIDSPAPGERSAAEVVASHIARVTTLHSRSQSEAGPRGARGGGGGGGGGGNNKGLNSGFSTRSMGLLVARTRPLASLVSVRDSSNLEGLRSAIDIIPPFSPLVQSLRQPGRKGWQLGRAVQVRSVCGFGEREFHHVS